MFAALFTLSITIGLTALCGRYGLPGIVCQQSQENCLAADGSPSPQRTSAERKAFQEYYFAVAMPVAATLVALHFLLSQTYDTILPLPVAQEVISSITRPASERDRILKSSYDRLEEHYIRSGMSHEDARSRLRVLWESWPFIGCAILCFIAVGFWATIQVTRRAATILAAGVLTRHFRYIAIDFAEPAHHGRRPEVTIPR